MRERYLENIASALLDIGDFLASPKDAHFVFWWGSIHSERIELSHSRVSRGLGTPTVVDESELILIGTASAVDSSEVLFK